MEHLSRLNNATTLASLLACAITAFIVKRRLRRLPLPPGPKRWPIVGNALSFPKEREWLTFMRWGRESDSELVYYEVWGKPFVVINSHRVAVELFERRSALYADRPRMPMLLDLCGWAWDLAFMPYDDTWKLARKLFTQHFRPGAAGRYRDEETRCARELLADLLKDDTHLFEVTRLVFGKLIMSVTYGIDVKSAEDKYITNAQKALFALTATGNVGTYLVDSIPLLKYVPDWVPGAKFQRDAREWRAATEAMAQQPVADVKAAMAEGVAPPSVLRSLLEDYGENASPQEAYAIMSATGTAYEAASETTWSATLTVILAMLLFPDIQAKAHAELDRVVSSDRFPDFSDQPSLPYIMAICKEALRWRTPLPLAVMHRVTKDDIYNGYHIPGSSTVVLNAWAILLDPAQYPNPEPFMPERFLTPSGELDSNTPEPTAAFGYGRRACAGSAMALDTLWIVVTSLLWAFDVRRAVDAEGKEVEVADEYTVGVVCYPAPFKCAMHPRSDSVRALILASG
ncbi:cytochrome P450 [Phanerochaete sordida]|uniref:Cytochrome P450 n=1 Tax=Phanerochaete sordida TaxID=48140 RepID=A0A9P3LET4_9APHY|nr:cytochrome P450 [Phanerochaete sordida]